MADINLGVGGANSAVAGGYTIDNSLKLESDNSERIQLQSQNIGTPTSDLKYTYSFWIKLTEPSSNCFVINGSAGAVSSYMLFENPNGFFKIAGNGGAYDLRTNRFFRDTSAWYHMVIAFDSTQSTASDRIKLYVNGVQETSFSTATYPSQNSSSKFYETNMSHFIGQESGNANCYITEIHWIDGQQLTPTDFGEFDSNTGIWKPIEYTGTYGNNGYYLDFENASSLGADSSGNGNNFTGLYGISSADQATDTPTNNFCTLNAVNLSTQTVTEGATKIFAGDNTPRTAYGTMAPSSGKWWWEGKIQVFESSYAYPSIGVTTNLAGLPSESAQNNGGHCIVQAKAVKWLLTSTGTSYGNVYVDNDIINVGLDLDNKKFYTYQNGTIDDANGIDISSTTFDDFGSQWMPLIIVYGVGASGYELNFGGYCSYAISSSNSDANGYGNFEYAPPSGYYALCSKNLAEYG